MPHFFGLSTALAKDFEQKEQFRLREAEVVWNFLNGIEETTTQTGIRDFFFSSFCSMFSVDSLKELVFQWFPLTPKTVRRLATLYVIPPRRKVINPDGSLNEEVTAEYNDEFILPQMVDVKLRDTQRLAKIMRTVLLKVRLDESNNKIKLDMVPNHAARVMPKEKDPTEAEKIAVATWRTANGMPQIAWEVWTDEGWELFIVDGTDATDEFKQFEAVDSDANPIGELPFVEFRDSITHHYWGVPRWSIIKENNFLNFLVTQLGENAAFQSFGVGVGVNIGLTGNREKLIKNGFVEATRVGPRDILARDNVGTDELAPSLTYASPPDNLASLQDTADWILKTAGVMEGLGSNTLNSEATEESGIALIFKNIELKEERESDKAFGKKAEADLFRLWGKFRERATGKKLKEGLRIVVDYDDSFAQPDPAQEFDIFKEKLALGIVSAADWLIKENPDLSQKDAIKKLREIADIESQIRPQPAAGLRNLQNLEDAEGV